MLSTVLTFALLTALVAGDDCDASVQIHPKGYDNLCLDVQGNIHADGTAVQVWECNNTGAQKWEFTDGAVKLAGTDFCLDAGSNPGNGIRMKIWNCLDVAAQKFTQSGNTIALGSAEQCLDMTEGNYKNGQRLQTWECYEGNPHQEWSTSAPALQSHRRRSRLRQRAACPAPSSSSSAKVPTQDAQKEENPQANAYVAGAQPVASQKAATTTAAAPAATTTTAAAPSNNNNRQMSPNGKKAGIAGGDLFDALKDHIGWWYDWAPDGANDHQGAPIYIPMLWGDGTNGPTDSQRKNNYDKMKNTEWTSTGPKYLLGFNEPDCDGLDVSAHMSVDATVQLWNTAIAPMADKGTILISPAPCGRGDFLTPFAADVKDFDIVAIHIYANSVTNAKNALTKAQALGKPIWVTEFGCVKDPGTDFNPCDSGDAKAFLSGMIDMFEDPQNNVHAYAPISNSDQVWHLMDLGSRQLTELGNVYLNAIKKYYP